MALMDAFEQLNSIGIYTVLITLLLVFICVPIFVKGIKEWKQMLGKTNRELKDESFDSEIKRLDKRIKEIENKFEERIDGLYNKQDGYHQETLKIRGNLVDNQEKLFDSISSFNKILNEIKLDLIEERMERKRWNVLNFADELRHGDGNADMERFDNVFRDYGDYETIIHDQGLTNGFVEESIKYIRLKYQDKMNI